MHTVFTLLPAQHQTGFAIEPMHALVVDRLTGLPQQNEQAPIAEARLRIRLWANFEEKVTSTFFHSTGIELITVSRRRLPEIGGFHFRGARLSINYLGTQNNLHILLVARGLGGAL